MLLFLRGPARSVREVRVHQILSFAPAFNGEILRSSPTLFLLSLSMFLHLLYDMTELDLGVSLPPLSFPLS